MMVFCGHSSHGPDPVVRAEHASAYDSTPGSRRTPIMFKEAFFPSSVPGPGFEPRSAREFFLAEEFRALGNICHRGVGSIGTSRK